MLIVPQEYFEIGFSTRLLQWWEYARLGELVRGSCIYSKQSDSGICRPRRIGRAQLLDSCSMTSRPQSLLVNYSSCLGENILSTSNASNVLCTTLVYP